MKAIILSNDKTANISPLNTQRDNAMMLPIANRPALEYMINFLSRFGINEIAVLGDISGNADCISVEPEKYNGLKLHFWETGFSGSNGNLSGMIGEFTQGESLILTKGNLFLDFDFERFKKFHVNKNSKITFGVINQYNKDETMENVSLNDNEYVDSIHCISSTFDRRKSLVPVGIYILSPDLLQSLNGNLSELFHDDGSLNTFDYSKYPSYVFRINGYCKTLRNIEDYFEINRDVLLGNVNNRLARKNEIGENVWKQGKFELGKNVSLVGPLVIGEGSVIKDDVQIIGPVVIGKNCCIGDSSFIRDSIIWSNSMVEERAKVIRSIVASNSTVLQAEQLDRNIRIGIESVSSEDLHVPINDFAVRNVLVSNPVAVRNFGYHFMKRWMDMFIAALGLLLASPVLFLVALIIRITSNGPAFFSQKRCGKDGKEFDMWKFRTMIREADELQEQLIELNETDGPVFKIKEDPRITRLGRILRKTSVDELPQLVNVLKGQMSIVGPRPLRKHEMRFCPSWRDVRLKVKPGITGMWQVNSRSSLSFHEWIMNDIHYVKSQSLWLDFKLMFLTFLKVIDVRNAH